MFLPGWQYSGKDPGLKVFTLANDRLPDMGSAPTILELGCNDTDFLERAVAVLPGARAHGIDWRAEGRLLTERADVLTWECRVRPDVVIALSAVEHFGLGHYNMDPLDPYGDIKVVQRVREWLMPGGFFYFDVPYAPEGYRVDGTKCRVYDDQAIAERFGPCGVLGYTESGVSGWIQKPARNCGSDAARPYYYVALLVRKGNGI